MGSTVQCWELLNLAWRPHTMWSSVADLGRGPDCPPLFWVKKKKITEGRKASRASKKKIQPP